MPKYNKQRPLIQHGKSLLITAPKSIGWNLSGKQTNQPTHPAFKASILAE